MLDVASCCLFLFDVVDVFSLFMMFLDSLDVS